MVTTPIGPKELALRAQRTEVARRYVPTRNKPRTVKTVQFEPAPDLHTKAAARAEQGQIRIAELEAEIKRLKHDLAKRVDITAVASPDVAPTPVTSPECPVCKARRQAQAARQRKWRKGNR